MAIAFLSLHSSRDPGVCRNEIAMALHHFGVVYPVMVEQVPFESIPVTIAHFQWPDLTQWKEKKETDLDFERFYEEKLLEIVNRIEGEATRFASEIDVLRKVLRPSTFEGKFAQHLEGFVGREWVFSAYEQWLEHQPDSRVFWLKAGPGFGKSALAVNLADRYRGAIIGTWFCDCQRIELRDPLRAVMTIAFQLANRWDDYRTRLLPRLGLFEGSRQAQIDEAIETLAKKNLDDLFTLLISEPLAGLIWREHKLVILMDALDEATDSGGKNALTVLIAGRFLELPNWISFLVTSRPDASVVGHLQRFKPFELSAEDSRNTEDLALYCRKEIGGLKVLGSMSSEDKEKLCTRLVEKAEGVILYIRMVAEGLKEGTLSVSDLDSMEVGLGGLYSRYYQSFTVRLKSHYKLTTQPLLRLVMAAPGPLPLELAAETLGWSLEVAHDVRGTIGSYLENDANGLRLFHKTLGEWLESESSGEFFTDPNSGRKLIGEFLWGCFENREEDENGITKTLKWEQVVLGWLPRLMPEISAWKEALNIWIIGSFLRQRMQWENAVKMLKIGVSKYESEFGQEHINTLDITNQLATLILELGKIDEAEQIIDPLLYRFEKTLGKEHEKTLDCLYVYSCLLSLKGEWDENEKTLRYILEARAKNQNHPQKLLVTLCALAQQLAISGKKIEAEAMFLEIIERGKKEGEMGEYFVFKASKEIGELCISLGDLERAYLLIVDSMDAISNKYGKNNLEYIHALTCLASWHRTKSDFEKSINCFEEVVRMYTNIYGVNHEDTLGALNNIAVVLQDQGKYLEAELIYTQVMEARIVSLGPEHPNTLWTTNGYGNLLSDKGEYVKAEETIKSVLKIRKRIFGDLHPHTLWSVMNLGNLYANMGNYWGAVSVLRESYNSGTESADQLRYVLAILEARSGNIETAKELIAEHLKKHPDFKEVTLKERYLEPIWNYINEL